METLAYILILALVLLSLLAVGLYLQATRVNPVELNAAARVYLGSSGGVYVYLTVESTRPICIKRVYVVDSTGKTVVLGDGDPLELAELPVCMAGYNTLILGMYQAGVSLQPGGGLLTVTYEYSGVAANYTTGVRIVESEQVLG